MRRLLLGFGALALALVASTGVQAAEHHGEVRHEVVRHEVIRHEVGHRYYEAHGVRFTGGYYYPGFEHHHWARQVWDARLNRWEYFDADLGCYFYWNAPLNAYYPVTYVCP